MSFQELQAMRILDVQEVMAWACLSEQELHLEQVENNKQIDTNVRRSQNTVHKSENYLLPLNKHKCRALASPKIEGAIH